MANGLQDNQQDFIPGIFDVARVMAGAAQMPGQREALLALMDKVCAAAPAELEAARAAWRAGRGEQAAATLHALRGSIGSLGAGKFAATSRELEAAVQDGVATDVLFDRARRELQATVDMALAWLERQQRQPRQAANAGENAGEGAGGNGSAASRAALAHWKTLLAARDFDAVAQYRQLLPALAPLGPDRAAAIDAAMARLDFATVLELLGEQP